MSRALAVVVLLSLGCEDDIGKDSDPATVVAGTCLRLKKPPRARCEAIAKRAALEVVRERPHNANEWMGYSIDCQQELEATARFAPGSEERKRLKEACCTIPDEQVRKFIAGLCAAQ